VLAFADPEIIRLASEDFIPVTGDDWYQRRREDAEGAFFRSVADQGPEKGGGSRQGIYCLTASGRLLSFKNHQDPEVMKEVLEEALRAWNRLPDGERRPGAVRVPDLGKTDARFARTPPEGGLILNVFTRILDRDGKGKMARGSCRFTGGDQAARDRLWLTREEWQSLIPADPRPGQSFPMPAAIAERLLRYHLVDDTRGEPPFWEADQVRKVRLTWTVESVSDEVLRLNLEGEALLATDRNPQAAERGFDVRLWGHLRYDRVKKAVYRFEMLAIGEHWGRGPYTEGERPGRKPLGVVFELTSGENPADRIPPQAARDFDYYMGRAR
jgi:hypothetical protein